MKKINAYIGLDVHKETIAVMIAESGRDDGIRFYGNIVNEKSTIYYNAKRLHSTLGYQTPVNFEKTLNQVSEIT